MKKALAGFLMGLMLLVFAAGYSYAAGEGCGDMRGAMTMHEYGMLQMGPMGHSKMGMMREGRRIRMALKDLGLDEKQKAEIRSQEMAARKDAIKKMADIKIARIELMELLDKDQVDMAAVEAKLKRTESLKTEFHLSRIKTFQEIKATLTPEQRQKFRANLRKQFMGRGRFGHGRNETMRGGMEE